LFDTFGVGCDGEYAGFCPAHAAMFATLRDGEVITFAGSFAIRTGTPVGKPGGPTKQHCRDVRGRKPS